MRHYGGTHILEVWTKQGERIFQMVMLEEITNWRLFDNTLVFRGSGDSKMIYVAFLEQRKMTAIQHPFETFHEADLVYFDQFLILIQKTSVRCVQLTPEEISTTFENYQTGDNNGVKAESPVLEKQFIGTISNERMVGLVNNYLRNELICVCTDASFHLIYYKVLLNKASASRVI